MNFFYKVLFSFIVFCYCSNIKAETFIVTSSADNGPNSLRDAIDKSVINGTDEHDFIYFNIPVPSNNNPVISLSSPLPPIGSSTTIDGTTQPSPFLGVSSAKVILLYKQSWSNMLYNYICFDLRNKEHINIWGMYLKMVPVDRYNRVGVGICINNSKDINIGMRGKGNIITGWDNGIGSYEYPDAQLTCANITIRCNMIGILPDGYSINYDDSPKNSVDALCNVAINIHRFKNLMIGGKNQEEGNYLNAVNSSITVFPGIDIKYTDLEGTIQNNAMNTDQSRMSFKGASWGSNYWGVIGLVYVSSIKVLDNIIFGNYNSAGIGLSNSDNIIIKRNLINVDINGNPIDSRMSTGIYLNLSNRVIIGGDNWDDRNIIAYTSASNGGIRNEYGDSVTITKNSTYCNKEYGSIFLSWGDKNKTKKPFIVVKKSEGDLIFGTATANAKIELFIDDDCPNCEGKTYVTTIKADAQGRWEYHGSNADKLVATATNENGSTSEFSRGGINPDLKPIIKNATCGEKNGSITNIEIISGNEWYWEDNNGFVVGKDTTLSNLDEGSYRLVIKLGNANCYWKSEYYTIKKISLPESITPSIWPTTCGKSNGAIYVSFNLPYTYLWTNSQGDSVGDSKGIYQVPPGSYFIKISLMDNPNCSMTYGPLVIENQNGPQLKEDNVKLVDASCGKNNGQIVGLNATNIVGTSYYAWTDNNNKIVSNNKDLQNVIAGGYRLVLKDQSSCDTIKSPIYTIKNLGAIIMDESKISVLPSGCNKSSGRIEGLTVAGGNRNEWKNVQTNAIVGYALYVDALPPGSYQMTATNDYGCSKISSVFTVASIGYTPINVDIVEKVEPNCGMTNNGAIRVKGFNGNASNYTFWWENASSGKVIGTGLSMDNLSSGAYNLKAQDINGCDGLVQKYSLSDIAKPVLNLQNMQVSDDICSSTTGSIRGIGFEGIMGNVSYSWINSAAQMIGNNIELLNIGVGTYKLTANNNGCIVSSDWIRLANIDELLPTPKYKTQTIIPNSPAILSIEGKGSGSYLLFQYPASTSLLQENSSGIFTVTNIHSDSIFYIQRKFGTCLSPIGKAEVLVWKSSKLDIPSAFTPNSDGRNDIFRIQGSGNIKLVSFAIYNRWGQQIFRTNQLSEGWNGRIKGQLCDAGTYVWLVDAIDASNGQHILKQGTVTLIR